MINKKILIFNSEEKKYDMSEFEAIDPKISSTMIKLSREGRFGELEIVSKNMIVIDRNNFTERLAKMFYPIYWFAMVGLSSRCIALSDQFDPCENDLPIEKIPKYIPVFQCNEQDEIITITLEKLKTEDKDESNSENS